MENIDLALDKEIKTFLSVGSGYGSGDGSGDGYGDGYGTGYGSGSGYGSGYGYGTGSGSGSGSGSGYGYGTGSGSGSGDGSGSGSGDGSGDGSGTKKWRSINGKKIYIIDNVATVVFSVHGNHALGAIVNKDLTITPCYIAKCGDYFAHGRSLKEASDEARQKYTNNMPVEDRIAAFREAHPVLDVKYGDLFQWHNTLTGSCRAGRESWCRNHSLQPTDSITVREFLEWTKNDYGGDIIRQLAKTYGIEL